MKPQDVVITETVFFGEDVAHHRVSVLPEEIGRWNLYSAKPRRMDDRARHYDLVNMLLFQCRSAASFDHLPELNAKAPEVVHASFADFLTHVGYRWSRNDYRARNPLKQAA